MVPGFSDTARKIGVWSAVGIVILGVVYAVTLVAGLLSLSSPQQPVGDPFFMILELLIIVMMPLMVALMAAIHSWASPDAKTLSLTALVFMSLVAGITCSLHFVILTVGRHAALAANPWLPLILSFRWPSIAYALDIVAWDIFFALSVLFAAAVFNGSRLATWIRMLLSASGALSLAGLSGVVINDMQWRNIGIVGYAGVFPVAALLIAVLFHRTTPRRV